jgi:hypothetical protein
MPPPPIHHKHTQNSAASKARDRFRESPRWLAFREFVKKERGGLCEFCGKKLGAGWNCHHTDSCTDRYEKLDPARFKAYCRGCHALLHELLHIATREGTDLRAIQERLGHLYHFFDTEPAVDLFRDGASDSPSQQKSPAEGLKIENEEAVALRVGGWASFVL